MAKHYAAEIQSNRLTALTIIVCELQVYFSWMITIIIKNLSLNKMQSIKVKIKKYKFLSSSVSK